MTYCIACERRRISGCHWFGGDNRQPEIRLRSQARFTLVSSAAVSWMSRNAFTYLGKRCVAWHPKNGLWIRVQVVFPVEWTSYLVFPSSIGTFALSRVDAFSVLIQHLPSRAEAAFSTRLTLGSLAGTCRIATTLFVSLPCPDTLVLWWHNDTQNVQSVNSKKMRGNSSSLKLHFKGNTSQVIFRRGTQFSLGNVTKARCLDVLVLAKNAWRAARVVHVGKIIWFLTTLSLR